MLINNCSRLYFDGIVEGSAHALLPGQWDAYRQFEKFIMPDMASAVLKTTAEPPGYYLPRVYSAPISNGDMSWCPEGSGIVAGSLTPTRPMLVALTGSGTFNATAALVVSMLLAMSGSGAMTAAMQGRLNATIDLTGSGSLSAAMSGFANMLIGLLGAGDLDATIAAYGNMMIDVVVTGTGLTTANVAQAVWSAAATANNDPGTMGQKLNNAASAGDPWGTDLPGAYVAGSAGHTLGNLLMTIPDAVWTAVTRELTASALTSEQADMLLEIYEVHGLKSGSPLTVTATSRSAGGVAQTINDNGAGTVTVTRT